MKEFTLKLHSPGKRCSKPADKSPIQHRQRTHHPRLSLLTRAREWPSCRCCCCRHPHHRCFHFQHTTTTRKCARHPIESRCLWLGPWLATTTTTTGHLGLSFVANQRMRSAVMEHILRLWRCSALQSLLLKQWQLRQRCWTILDLEEQGRGKKKSVKFFCVTSTQVSEMGAQHTQEHNNQKQNSLTKDQDEKHAQGHHPWCSKNFVDDNDVWRDKFTVCVLVVIVCLFWASADVCLGKSDRGKNLNLRE